MPIELKMPALSPTMEEGTLAKWLVKEGDTVSSGDLLAEIETDKATMEFEAVDEGVVIKILVAEGSEGVKVGTPIALIGEEGESPSPPAGEGQAGKASQGEGAAPTVETPAPEAPAEGGGETPSAPPAPAPPLPAQAAPESPSPAEGRGASERVKASPLARRLAEAQGIDLASLTGSGPGGRIVRADLGDGAG